HIRVAARLIHGQVATLWATGFRVNRFMFFYDRVAVNDDEKSILRMAAPAGVNTSILTFEKGLNNVKNGNYKGQRVLLIVKTPEILVQLMNGGLALKEVNIGNMSSRPGTIQIKKSISMTEDEKVAVEQLLRQGVKVTAQMVPEESDASIEGFLN
ncbi:PTS sugar transporter subunit IIB, partial [Bacillus cereus]